MTENNPIERLLSAKADAIDSESSSVDAADSVQSVIANPNLTQHLTRTVEDNVDTIVGYFRCRFDVGQQRYSLHFVVHPAFENKPDVEAIPLDIDEMRIRVTDCLTYGIRAELVLPKPATEPTQVLVEIIASAGQNNPITE